jgi:hypothetical protein
MLHLQSSPCNLGNLMPLLIEFVIIDVNRSYLFPTILVSHRLINK